MQRDMKASGPAILTGTKVWKNQRNAVETEAKKLPLKSVPYAVDNSLNNSPIWRQHWLCRGCSKNRHMRRHGEPEYSRSIFKTRISRDWRLHFLKSRVQRVSSTWHRASRTGQYPRPTATKFALQHTGTPSRPRQTMSVRTSMSSDPA